MNGCEGDMDAPREDPAQPEAEGSEFRVRMLQRFEAWLDGVMAAEPVPEGISETLFSEISGLEGQGGCPSSDLFSLWSALTGLTQEIRLQGRTFKQLREALGPMEGLSDVLGDVQEMLKDEDARRAERSDMASLVERAEPLLDLRDRLLRGLQSCRASLDAHRAKKREGFFRARMPWKRPGQDDLLESVVALEKGVVLTLKRLEEELEALGVHEILAEGEPFDPSAMNAVEVELNDALPDGRVIGVVRRGYRLHGQMVRPVLVKVSRRAGGMAAQDERGE